MTSGNANEVTGVGLPVGSKIGKYEVRERIGAGGQATVYKCYDALLDRYVAIKQISSHLAEDRKFLERFRKEAQILARLGGEVITVHELVEDERGLFIVMEFVAGHTLETILRDTGGPVEAKAALKILWRLAATLNEVHAVGIVHRDLKPGNIIIAEGLRPRITDFGVAASSSGQTSMVLGTTKYMAPEMFEGGPSDGRADLYSLGFVVYELLVGRPKFNEIFADVVRDRHSESMRWMKWHGNHSVSAPPAHEVNPEVPEALSGIVSQMMAKDPDERFEGMEALGRAIKSAFSPKGRASATARAAEERLARHGRRAAKRLSAERQDLAPGADEAEELEVELEDGAPTAPLPKTALSLRTKLILGGVVAAGFIAVVSVLGYKIHRRSQAQAEAADTVFRKAETAFGSAGRAEGDADYDEAKTKFNQALKGFEKLSGAPYQDSAQAVMATALVHLCRAHLATIEGAVAHPQGQDAQPFWDRAEGEREAAKKAFQAIQASRDDLRKWTQKGLKDLKDFANYQLNTRTFVERMTRARNFFESGQRDDALVELDFLSGATFNPTVYQEGRMAALRKEILIAGFQASCDTEIQAGDAFLRTGKIGDAEQSYNRALALLKSDDATILSTADRTDYERSLATRMLQLGTDKAYAIARREADDAQRRGDKNAELRALDRALKIRKSKDLEDRVSAIRGGMSLERGKRFLADKRRKNLLQARRSFEEALRFLKDNKTPAGTKIAEDARAQIASLDSAEARAELIAEGDVAFSSAKYDDALAKFQQASKHGLDQALSDKITECRFRKQMAEAIRLREEDKYEEARKAYEKAAAIKPSEQPSINAAILSMMQQKDYRENLAAGDAAAKEREYTKAVDHYQKARQLIDTAEVKERISRVRYEENLARGKSAQAGRDYAGARAYYKIAKRYRETAEVKTLIAEVERLLQENSSD